MWRHCLLSYTADYRCHSKVTFTSHRVTTCLENLEMLGNLTAVRDFTKCQGSVREKILLGKSCLKLFIVSCIFASIPVLSRSLVWFRIMHCCIPTPITDSNTSTGMIWVTLNMPSATEECCEPSGKCQGISDCLEIGHRDYSELQVLCVNANTNCYMLIVEHKRQQRIGCCTWEFPRFAITCLFYAVFALLQQI